MREDMLYVVAEEAENEAVVGDVRYVQRKRQ